MQDNDKGTIVGRRSFGKGLVQQEMDLGDGSAVRLTVSRYYTPTGRSIQKPYNHTGNDDYYNDFEKRYDDGELINADSIKVNDTLKYLTPKGKTVYGGGGIIPDVFVPIDTTRYFNSMHYRTLNSFVFDYIDTHRDDFVDLNSQDFEHKYYPENQIFNKYLLNISAEEADPNDLEYQNVNMYLKALFIQQLYDDNAFYQILNQNDKMLQKILELEQDGYSVIP